MTFGHNRVEKCVSGLPQVQLTLVLSRQTELGDGVSGANETDGDVVEAKVPIARREVVARDEDQVVVGHDPLLAQVHPLGRNRVATANDLISCVYTYVLIRAQQCGHATSPPLLTLAKDPDPVLQALTTRLLD